MKIFQVRDESVVGDILVQYLMTPNEELTEEEFQMICKEYEDKGISDLSVMVHMLVAEKGFVPFTVSGTHMIQSKDMESETAYERFWEVDAHD